MKLLDQIFRRKPQQLKSRTYEALVCYRLSEAGQRAAKRSDENARQKQCHFFRIPEECTYLFHIDRDGHFCAAMYSGATWGPHHKTIPRFAKLNRDVDLDDYPKDWADIYRYVLENIEVDEFINQLNEMEIRD